VITAREDPVVTGINLLGRVLGRPIFRDASGTATGLRAVVWTPDLGKASA
jgi:hypothetical protein